MSTALTALKFYNDTFTSSPYLTLDLVPDWSSQSVLDELVILQPGVELKLDCAINGIRHDANGVEAVYREKGAGEDSVIRGKYLIGADGKRGFVRKGYLEERGIEQKTGL
ncbi:hypothetical protein ColTof4_03122 [Colletotrichum tofieldiae]|nr:hypothetical protein ColTof4_03122 [Colletotrichum tofieldiae]